MIWLLLAQPALGACFHKDVGWLSECAPTPRAALVATDSNQADFAATTKAVPFRGLWEPDGVECTRGDESINSGPMRPVLTCTDSNNAFFDFGTLMPRAYTGGPVTVRLSVISLNSSPGSTTVEFTCNCQCLGDGDVADGTFGTSRTATISLSGQYKEEFGATSPAMTCTGTCTTHAAVNVRCTVDEGDTTAVMADVRVTDTLLEYPSLASEE